MCCNSTRVSLTLNFGRGSADCGRFDSLYFTDGIEEALFDTLHDPFEMQNLASEPTHAELKAMLAACLQRALPPNMALRVRG